MPAAVVDLQSRNSAVLELSNVRNPSVSPDGRYVALEDVIVRYVTLLDRLMGVPTVVGDPTRQHSYPLLTGNGR